MNKFNKISQKKVYLCSKGIHFIIFEFYYKYIYSTLRTHLSVIIVDALEFEPEISKVDKEKAMEAREGFYQTQLKTLERYGGMNTLDSNHILFKSAGT